MPAKPIEYDDPRFHVSKRTAFPQPLKPAIASFQDGYDRTRLFGEAQFWTQIHGHLLGQSDALPKACEQVLENRDRVVELAPQLVVFARQLVAQAHGHHHIEDEHFFPVFLSRFPQLAAPIDMLENDHNALAAILERMEQAISAFKTDTDKGATAVTASLMQATEDLHGVSGELDRLFRRHIGDEEEICLPVLMRLQQG